MADVVRIGLLGLVTFVLVAGVLAVVHPARPHAAATVPPAGEPAASASPSPAAQPPPSMVATPDAVNGPAGNDRAPPSQPGPALGLDGLGLHLGHHKHHHDD